MNFLVKTDLTSFPSSIEFNFEEIKAELEEKLTYYRNLVVSEDGIKAAKSDKAKLNSLATAIDDKRKEIKAACLAPYNDFETKCKELVSLVKAPVTAIDTQIKEFDEIKKQNKYEELKAYFDENIKELSELVKLDDIINPKWANATAKIDTLKNEIGDKIDRIRLDLSTINEQYADVPYKSAILAKYTECYDLSRTLIHASNLKRQAEMQAKALSQTNSKTAPPPPTVEPSTSQTIMPGMETAVQAEPLGKVVFEVVCTRSQLISLRDFMKKNSIEFKTIKKKKDEE